MTSQVASARWIAVSRSDAGGAMSAAIAAWVGRAASGLGVDMIEVRLRTRCGWRIASN